MDPRLRGDDGGDMITVPQIVEDILKASPILSESVEDGLVNYSSLARKLQPEIEEKLFKKVTVGSIIMALKRLKLTRSSRKNALSQALGKITDLSMRSNLISMTFSNSPTLLQNQSDLLKFASKVPNIFLTISHGVYETTIFISKNLEDQALGVFKNETVKLRVDNLSSITLILPTEAIEVPGIHYSVFKRLFSNGINVFEAVSSFTELTIFLHSDNTEKAFAVLKRLN